MLDCFTGILKPLMEKLDDLNRGMQKISQVADEAHFLAAQHSNRIARLQEQGYQVFKQTDILSNKICFFNLNLSPEMSSSRLQMPL